MHPYRIFGGVLVSEIPLPDLSELPHECLATPDWRFARATDAGPADGAPTADLLGSERVMDGVRVRLFRTRGGYRLDYDDTGCYEILSQGRDIRWHAAEADLDAVRTDLTGRVLACALHAAGVLTLHASAVAFGDRAVAFLGPKGVGKSTLALAAAAAGAGVLSDDTLPVRSEGGRVLARPGVPQLLVHHDTSGTLLESEGERGGSEPGKRNAPHLGRGRFEVRALPLAAIYALAPADSDAGPQHDRTRLSPRDAAVVLTAGAKLGALLGGSERGVVLDYVAGVASAVPVYTLAVPRSLDLLASVVEDLEGWTKATG